MKEPCYCYQQYNISSDILSTETENEPQSQVDSLDQYLESGIQNIDEIIEQIEEVTPLVSYDI